MSIKKQSFYTVTDGVIGHYRVTGFFDSPTKAAMAFERCFQEECQACTQPGEMAFEDMILITDYGSPENSDPIETYEVIDWEGPVPHVAPCGNEVQ